MISMGMALTSKVTPPPYAAVAASNGSVNATTAAGADPAMPMTVSWVTPIASGSSRVSRGGAVSRATVTPPSALPGRCVSPPSL